MASLRDVRDARVGDTILDANERASELAPRLPRRQIDGLRRALSDRVRSVRGPPRRAREAAPQRREPSLRARIVHRARLRIPVRISRTPSHGDRAGTARAGIQSRPDHHGADRGIPCVPHRRGHAPAREPEQPPRSRRDLPHRGAVRQGPHHGAGRVHRRNHAAGARAARSVQRYALHRYHPRRVRLRVSSRAKSCSTSTTS